MEQRVIPSVGGDQAKEDQLLKDPGDSDDDGPRFAETPRESSQVTMGWPEGHSQALKRQEQLDALRADVIRVRTELMAIAAGTSRLTVMEAMIGLRTVESGIKRHLAPALIIAGVAGYLWTAFVRNHR